jgi:hypothetical protein
MAFSWGGCGRSPLANPCATTVLLATEQEQGSCPTVPNWVTQVDRGSLRHILITFISAAPAALDRSLASEPAHRLAASSNASVSDSCRLRDSICRRVS